METFAILLNKHLRLWRFAIRAVVDKISRALAKPALGKLPRASTKLCSLELHDQSPLRGIAGKPRAPRPPINCVKLIKKPFTAAAGNALLFASFRGLTQ